MHGRPHMTMLRESAPRSGFFEREQFEAVQRHLPEALRGLLGFAYITGWRVASEVQPLEWRQVDLPPARSGSTPVKRRMAMGGWSRGPNELRRILECSATTPTACSARRTRWCRWCSTAAARPSPRSRRRGGPPAWRLGCPGRIPHDLRRAPVRNLVRAGVPERVAMQMTGTRPARCSSGTTSSARATSSTLHADMRTVSPESVPGRRRCQRSAASKNQASRLGRSPSLDSTSSTATPAYSRDVAKSSSVTS